MNQRLQQSSAASKSERPALKITVTLVLFLIPLVVFLLLANAVRGDQPLPGDIAVLNAVHSAAFPALDTLMVAITETGSAKLVVPAVLVAAGVLFYLKKRWQALFLLFAAGGTSVVNVLFKHIFQRERPELWDDLVKETSFSFPSGHAMISSTLALAVIILCWRTRLRVPAIIAGIVYFLGVSFSRLYVGVHYPSDVIAGWCVSAIWVAAVYYVFTYFRNRRLTDNNLK